MVATMQAVGFTTVYLTGTLAILGVNPVTKWKQLKQEKELMLRESDEQNLHDSLTSMTVGQKQLVKGLNALGISNDSILTIEKEMRDQDQKAIDIQEKAKEQKDIKK